MLFTHIVVNVDMDEEEREIIFTEKEKNNFVSADKKIFIVMEQDSDSDGKRIYVEKCSGIYAKYKDLISGLFEVKYNEILKEMQENFESGFENSGYQEEEGIKVPYDPKQIMVAPAKFSLKEIVSMIDGEDDEEPVLDLAPEFQRDYVWDNIRKSRLIESILLNIPLPMFYFARDKKGRLQVVDGVQRLTTIYKFFKNEFRLSRLEYLDDCAGKYFKKKNVSEEKNLSPKLVRALRQYQIDCNIIEPSTPENVKLDIFKRLNTGGKELNKQEVRHAFMKKDVRDFVKKMVETPEFLEATAHSISDKRMMAQELILRYIGFYCLFINDFINVNYTPVMDDFLDSIAIKLNDCGKIPYDMLYKHFMEAMKKSTVMFGNKAFRKIDIDYDGDIIEKRNPINKSLFITFSISLSVDYSMNEICKKGNIVQEFAHFLNEDEEFYNSISHNTNYQLKDTAMTKVRLFLDSIYEGDEREHDR